MAKTTTTAARLREDYKKTLASSIAKDLSIKNAHDVPKLEKVIVSVGLGKSQGDKRMFEVATNTLTKITGQAPMHTIARKSIAGFKLREGSKIGMKVTLRGDRMYEFLDRMINIVIPRLRDFHGVSVKSFDGSGNYSVGFKEQSVFPELTFEDITTAHGIQVTIVTDSDSDEKAQALLTALGMPFEKKEAK